MDFIGKISDEKDHESYLIVYNGTGGTCFLDPRIFQPNDANADLVKLLNKDLCKFSEEELIIQGIAENINASESVIGIIQNPDGGYFAMPVEIIPIKGFEPAAAISGLAIAGGAVSVLPYGWVVVIAVGAGVGVQQLYFHREELLKQARRNIEIAQMLLDLNGRLLIFKPLEGLSLDIDNWWPNANHLINSNNHGDLRDSGQTDFPKGRGDDYVDSLNTGQPALPETEGYNVPQHSPGWRWYNHAPREVLPAEQGNAADLLGTGQAIFSADQSEQEGQDAQAQDEIEYDERAVYEKVYNTAKQARERELVARGEIVIKNGKKVARPLRPEELSQLKEEVSQAVREIKEFEIGCKRDFMGISALENPLAEEGQDLDDMNDNTNGDCG